MEAERVEQSSLYQVAESEVEDEEVHTSSVRSSPSTTLAQDPHR